MLVNLAQTSYLRHITRPGTTLTGQFGSYHGGSTSNYHFPIQRGANFASKASTRRCYSTPGQLPVEVSSFQASENKILMSYSLSLKFFDWLISSHYLRFECQFLLLSILIDRCVVQIIKIFETGSRGLLSRVFINILTKFFTGSILDIKFLISTFMKILDNIELRTPAKLINKINEY